MENYTNRHLEPTAGSAYGYGWQKMKENFTNLLVIVIILMVAQSVSGAANSNDPSFSEGSLSFLIWLLITGPVLFGCEWVFLKAVRGNDYEIKDAFSAFNKDFFEVMLANLIVTVIIIVGFIFLIVPGIIFAIKLSFVPYLVMDKQMKAMDAIKKSWEMTTGYGAQIFFIGLLSIFIVIGGLLLFIVGIFPAIMWIKSTMASFYYSVEQTNPDTEPATSTS
jgi:energy-converting hydrogenase Eha subunit A